MVVLGSIAQPRASGQARCDLLEQLMTVCTLRQGPFRKVIYIVRALVETRHLVTLA